MAHRLVWGIFGRRRLDKSLGTFDALCAKVKRKARRVFGSAPFLEHCSRRSARLRGTDRKIARPERQICCAQGTFPGCFFNHLGVPHCRAVLRLRFAGTRPVVCRRGRTPQAPPESCVRTIRADWLNEYKRVCVGHRSWNRSNTMKTHASISGQY
jgi:hypothetical protein